MHFSTFLTGLAMMSTTGWAQYVLQDDYMSGGFFDEFTFFTGADPTDGFVAYQDQSDAQQQGLIETPSAGGGYIMRVDNSSVTPNGRPSVRLTSNKSYQLGLVIIELDHMPASACGSWPAFWMVGPNWPNDGEIDIIEGVNDNDFNSMTLHTGPGCSISKNENMESSSSVSTTSCDSSGSMNTGCGIETTQTNTYGNGFNSAGGGTYAMEWTSSGISMYFWSADSAPSDVSSGSPDPSSWSTPIASFTGSCDMSTAFQSQQIVFDTTFCGAWAGDVWSGSSCAASTGVSTCNDYVQNHPEAFEESYWSVKSLKVYQNNGGSSPPQSAAPSAPATSSWASVAQPTQSAEPSAPVASSSAWAPVVTSSGVASAAPVPTESSAAAPVPTESSAAAPVPTESAAPAPSSPAESSPAVSQPASHTWGGNPSWPTGGWAETADSDGGYDVSAPAAIKERHIRHLRHHKRHGPGRL